MAATNIIGRLHLQGRVALFTLLWIVPGALRPAFSQEYPSGLQIAKDGTAVLVEDYASLPVSTARKEALPIRRRSTTASSWDGPRLFIPNQPTRPWQTSAFS